MNRDSVRLQLAIGDAVFVKGKGNEIAVSGWPCRRAGRLSAEGLAPWGALASGHRRCRGEQGLS